MKFVVISQIPTQFERRAFWQDCKDQNILINGKTFQPIPKNYKFVSKTKIESHSIFVNYWYILFIGFLRFEFDIARTELYLTSSSSTISFVYNQLQCFATLETYANALLALIIWMC